MGGGAVAVTTSIAGPVRRRLARTVFPLPWAALAAAIVASLLGFALDGPARYAPLLLSVVVLGLPHGALDHLTLPRARGARPTSRSLAAVGALYLVLGGLYAAGWFLAPAAAFVAFLALTWVHWGQGDVYSLVALSRETHLRTRGQRLLAAAVRGGIPMVVPLVGFPETYRAVAATTAGLFVSGASFAWLLAPSVRLVAGGAVALLTVASLLLGRARADDSASRDAWRLDAGESLLLWAFFLAVPPLVAIGLYFALWHSLRHLARLAALDPSLSPALRRGRPLSVVVGLGRDALPLTLGAVILLAGLAAAVPAGVGSVDAVASVSLVLLAVLTLPHVVVVSCLDRVQGLW
ncbi:Brp/Blh family beta-carotene 15,15'-dioxygenase [Halogeometricum sp. S1BR25-6]|uniref:Probable beta-carotene 15,15'-dioxygenase n=1 Tax=Halogeometricum salsisoli TaxID=2950536 RepID=A0ABU2G9U6_9EURY|nr:Brp/Blh family beta-carotene 15,15'-dioxygenase [Halogeometricum sp. S1BR25-6]MDS0297586.1 Brp/Blh family beta-carotene 15,15'-dioxygenase [Halogeometricum sp. S1BR25-6]